MTQSNLTLSRLFKQKKVSSEEQRTIRQALAAVSPKQLSSLPAPERLALSICTEFMSTSCAASSWRQGCNFSRQEFIDRVTQLLGFAYEAHELNWLNDFDYLKYAFSLVVRPQLDQKLVSFAQHALQSFNLTPEELAFTQFLFVAKDTHFGRPFFDCFEANELIVAEWLNCSQEQLFNTCGEKSALVKSGIIIFDVSPEELLSSKSPITEKFELNTHVAWAIRHRKNVSQQDLIKSALIAAPEPLMTAQDFKHLNTDLLKKHLKSSVSNNFIGTNILLYGPPGTGKTQLSRWLAKATKSTLFEVNEGLKFANDRNIFPNESENRLKATRFGLKLLATHNSNVVLSIDECENVLDGLNSKYVLNQLLESNEVPIIWIANDIYSIDKAVMRRFDLILEVPIPPKSVKARLFREQLNAYAVSKQYVDKLASHADMTVAQVASATKVLNSLQLAGDRAEQALSEILSEKMQAIGCDFSPSQYSMELNYNTQFTNTQGDDLGLIRDALAANDEGRLLMSGPPGCGKTGFAHHLAEYTNKPLVEITASSVLSPFIGETERNIAQMFHDTQQQGAILLIDEVDSLLSNRAGHHANWQTSQVNEMLSRMERYSGILIATTNRPDALDPAVRRRFDFSLDFNYLTQHQAEQMFLKLVGKKRLPAHIKRKFAALSQLTPGDFSQLKRKMRFRAEVDVDLLTQWLLQEQSAKTTQHNPMGFIQ
ncbi:AAA family ATPase [Neiella marina]|uniref:AAA family ATPase n=1 Tax=Neiella holothuriorum TaxID=2870530 RepID=A0ABS7EMC5_9GAMM|nr:AAA family ATPase [Neiella holothuriorum]MBW8192746.1 AAA family ATPase [Neiella holothuriorum]